VRSPSPGAPGARSRRSASPAASGGAGQATAPDKIKIGPLCRWVMPISELAAWLDAAKPGERVAYARGLALASGSASAHLAREWAAAGLVHLFQVPVPLDGGGREFEFLVERRRVALPPVAGGVPGDWPDIHALALQADFDAGRVFALLKRAATFAQHCPTNGEIAEQLFGGAQRHERARYLVGKLVTAGVIEVTHDGPAYRRVVRILPDGPSTIAGRL
jgi:hypothetical protein